MRYLFTYSLLLLCCLPAQAGGGWPQPKGEFYLKFSQWWLISDQHYTDQGLLDPNVTNGLFNTSLYAEYGLSHRLTGILYFPFFSRAYFNNTVSATTGEVLKAGEAINSLGDSELSLKYGLITGKPVLLSLTLTLGLPLGIDDGGSDRSLQTGDGEFNQMLRIDLSTAKSFGQLNTFYTLYLGINNRSKGFSDEIRYGLEAGGSFFGEKLLLILRLYGTKSLRNGTLSAFSNSTSIFANNSEHLTFSPELAWQFSSKAGLSFSWAKVLRGKIIFADPAWSAGVFFKF